MNWYDSLPTVVRVLIVLITVWVGFCVVFGISFIVVLAVQALCTFRSNRRVARRFPTYRSKL